MMVSYEAERRMVRLFDEEAAYGQMRRRARLLDFKTSGNQPLSMTVFPLIYPCMTLAEGFDPFEEARTRAKNGQPPDRQDILSRAEAFLQKRLTPITAPFERQKGPQDESWYWVALAALDGTHHPNDTRVWLETDKGDDAWWQMVRFTEDVHGNFYQHIQRFLRHLRAPQDLGRPPRDLVPVLAKVTVASPAVVALRSLLRLFGRGKDPQSRPRLLAGAARMAIGFRSLFNLPETMSLIRGLRPKEDNRYWESVLDYCVDGNLQSVMDEYAHMLREGLGLLGKSLSTAIHQLSKEVQAAAALRTVNLAFDEIFPKGSPASEPLKRHSMRCRFALRFGDGRNEEDSADVRKDLVRSAFNSPFRPFVLATTSIGQEGLDFHPYCHDICHWNLPSNPVDLEQREGRIQRYKGHAIRRNLARAFPLGKLKQSLKHQDPWEVLFRLALAQREKGLTDLVPFWSYDIEDGYCIRRCVPTFPLSRDREHLVHLQSTLVAYRMVLGQPRQEDLVDFLREKFSEDKEQAALDVFRIDLGPR
jgi:hypothetical protein